jgi:molybdopterin-guanine dinucleotide biosynthesis protein A
MAHSAPRRRCAVGIFVGGRGLRLGGVAKGHLRHQGTPLIERLVAAVHEATSPEPAAHLYLVGAATAYAQLALPSLDDAPAGKGPIGGLRALLVRARDEGLDAIALAVDLPYLRADLIRRLLHEAPEAAALAPRQAERWQPLVARYRSALVLPVVDAALDRGSTSLQAIFEGLSVAGQPAVELALSADELRSIDDWDLPSDLPRDAAPR